MNELLNLEEEYNFYKNGKNFNQRLENLLNEYASRPSLLYLAKNIIDDLREAKIYLKREDVDHTGSHKINNVLDQVLLVKKWVKIELLLKQELVNMV